MHGETNLTKLLQNMSPQLQTGDYVFCTVKKEFNIPFSSIISIFKEKEGVSIILPKTEADKLGLPYAVVMSWITLNIHSALEAVGLTAAVSAALGNENISCNVVAAFYHDHIFVPKVDAAKAMKALEMIV